MKLAGWLAAALCCVTTGAVLAQTQPSSRMSGTIVAADASTLTVRPSDGDALHVHLAHDVRISSRAKADWSDIKPGDFIASTAVPQSDGTLIAKEVRIFAESMRGSGEGHYPMQTPGDTMTNATVSRVSGARPHDTMTNATVASASQGADHRMTVTYKGGEKTIVVPPGVPVMRQAPGDRALLAPGAHVVLTTHRAPDGGLVADRITVGKDGFTPPL